MDQFSESMKERKSTSGMNTEQMLIAQKEKLQHHSRTQPSKEWCNSRSTNPESFQSMKEYKSTPASYNPQKLPP
jgi:hypothetical protein